MQTKLFEVRDRNTLISALAVRLRPDTEAERWLLAHAGYGREPDTQAKYLFLCKLTGGESECQYDPYGWGDSRTMRIAHQHLEAHFDALPSGAVVCVEFLCGERAEPKQSDAPATV